MQEFSTPALLELDPTARADSTRSRRSAQRGPDAACCSPAGPASGGAPVTAKEFADRGRARWPPAWSPAASGPATASALMSRTRYEWTLVRLRDLDRRCRHRADLRDVLRRAGAVEPRRLAAPSPSSSRRRRTRARSTRSAASCPTWRTSWQIDDGGLDELVAAGREVPEPRARRAAGRRSPPRAWRRSSTPPARPAGPRAASSPTATCSAPGAARARAARAVRRHRQPTLLFLPLAHVFARFVQVACVESRRPDGPHRRHQEPAAPTCGASGRRSCCRCRACSRRSTTAPGSKAHGDGKGAIFDAPSAPRSPTARRSDTRRRRPRRCACSTRCSTGWSTASCGPRWAGRSRTRSPAARRSAPGSGHFFRGIGVTILEGYGLTETSAAEHRQHPRRSCRIGTVGRPLARRHRSASPTTARSSCRGDHVFRGYWHNDAGHGRDRARRLVPHRRHRRARRRRLPARSPAARRRSSSPPAARTSRRPCSRTGCAPTRWSASAWSSATRSRSSPASSRSTPRRCRSVADAPAGPARTPPVADLVDDPELRAELQQAVDEANRAVSQAEAIRQFAVLPVDWTEEGGQLTPSLKLKRGGRHGGVRRRGRRPLRRPRSPAARGDRPAPAGSLGRGAGPRPPERRR